jgi:hypothetical protein
MKKLIILCLIFTFCYNAHSQYSIDNYVISNGYFQASNASFTLEGTIGQSAIGEYNASGIVIFQAGFWYGVGSQLPSLTTTAITNITHNSAVSGGNITSDGGTTITARGICWSTNSNPIISNNISTVSGTTGTFTANLTGLSQNTLYYVRAYASNTVGTSYGNEQTFTTQTNGGGEDCPSHNLLQNLTFNSSNTYTYRSSGTITTAGSGTSFTVNSGTVTLIAGQRIKLLFNTKVNAGAKFKALINGSPCSYNPREILPPIEEDEQLPKKNYENISEDNDVIIYPNPNNGRFIIRIDNYSSQDVSIEIRSVIGSLILADNLNNKNLIDVDISQQSKGFYFVIIRIGNEVFVRKIIYN